MAEQKHTPGPWSRKGWSIRGPDGRGLACVTGNVKRPEQECLANLRLIAAAPDLLAALKELAERVGMDHDTSEARAAITKAEGREATP